MEPIVLLSTVIHVLVTLRGAKFLVRWSDSRDDDRAVVASIVAMSVLFILAQCYTLATDPSAYLSNRAVLRIGFDAASGLVFLAVVRYVSNCCARRAHPQ